MKIEPSNSAKDPISFRRVFFAFVYVSLGLQISLSSLQSAERPNVILIVTDDQGYGDMSCHGNPWLKTPHLDQLAAQSARLEDYHVDPVCTPTRAALMTGRYCTRVGAWTVTQGRQLLRDNEITMADVFSHSGYRTGMFGKWHLGDTWPYAPRFRGFDEVVCHRAGGIDEIGNAVDNDFFDDTYFRNGAPEKLDGYCTDVFFRELTRFVKKDSDKHFFAYLPLNAMHSPYKVAEKYSARFAQQGHPENRADFYGMIENFDENLGRLMETLHEENLADETIVIFMGDNGTAEGIDGPADSKPGFNAGMHGKKGSTFEGGHRVACFVSWPGHFVAGREIQELTCHRDWLPTLIELCDLTQPTSVAFDGKSIVPLLQQTDPQWPERTMFVQRQGDQPELKQSPKAGPRFPHYAVLTEQWRLVDGQLFDHRNDPGQETNVANDHPQVVTDLCTRYEEHFADVFREGKPFTYFKIGGDENPTRFTVRDWHPAGGTPAAGQVIWKQDQVADESLQINGFWMIDVVQAGNYSIRLSRSPDDAPAPINATTAKLQVGNRTLEKSLRRSDRSVSFQLELSAGETRMQTWFTNSETRTERGAYFVEAERIGEDVISLR